MPSMYDMMYGGGTPDTQQGYGSFQRAMNSPMTQAGLRMMQGQPFAQPAPAPVPSPSGRRRIRIGNKVYEEVADNNVPQAPTAAPAAQY